MKKKISDEEFLDKLCKASIEMEANKLENIEDDKFKKEFVNEVSKIKNNTVLNKKFWFVVATSMLIIFIFSFVLVISNNSSRYSYNNENAIKTTISIEELNSTMPQKLSYISEIDTENIETITLYQSNNNENLATKIIYLNKSYLLIILSNNFIYTDNEKFNNENTQIEIYETYSIYQTIYATQNGRKTIKDYYIYIKSNEYQYYLYQKNSNQDEVNSVIEKIIQNF